MDPISLTNINGNLPVQLDTLPFEAEKKTPEEPRREAFVLSTAPENLVADGIADIPDSALTRDDAFGRKIHAAFSLPPPPMPNFPVE